MRRINGTTHYTIEELVEAFNSAKDSTFEVYDIVDHITSVPGLRDVFRRYGAPKTVRVGTTNYYEWDQESDTGAFADWANEASEKAQQRYRETVFKATGQKLQNLIEINHIIRKNVTRVTFYNYYNKSENPPQKFKVGNRTYFLYNEIKEWAKQFPALDASTI